MADEAVAMERAHSDHRQIKQMSDVEAATGAVGTTIHRDLVNGPADVPREVSIIDAVRPSVIRE